MYIFSDSIYLHILQDTYMSMNEHREARIAQLVARLTSYLCHAGSNLTGDTSQILIIERIRNGSCICIYQCHLPGCGGFTGYFPVKRRELPWLSPTN